MIFQNTCHMPYVDEDLDKMTFPDLGEQITQEVGNQYVLLRGNKMVCGTIKTCKHDYDSKPIGHCSENPILDMLYIT